jgi:dienelactone hydrolase
VESAGDYSVGTTRLETTRDGITYTLQAWFPTAAPASSVAIEQLEAEPHRTQYAGLLAAAPAGCPTRTLDVALDAEPLAGAFPLIVLSHCHSCTRLSNATTAVRLASHGFVALSVDHVGDSLWDELAGTPGDLDAEGLQQRVDAIEVALDLDAPALVGVDRSKIGVLGHSFGGVTAGRVAQLDARVLAAVSLAAPVENPLIPGVTLADIHKPLEFLVAQEDNSILEVGNDLIRGNFTAAPGPAWKHEVADAGHWSVSDLVGLVPAFMPGCGEGERQTKLEAFTYLDPARGRQITASYATALFQATLLDDAAARDYLDHAAFAEVSVEHHD